MILVDFDAVLESVQANIEAAQAWLIFPRQFVKFKKQLADYIRGVACYLDVFIDMFGGWLSIIKEQVTSYAELIATIMEIIFLV